MPTLTDLRKSPHHSYSSLNTFLNVCPLQYAMRYVYGVEPERTSVGLVFGSAFHGALSWLASRRRDGDYSDPDELAEVFSECWGVECRNAGKLSFGSAGEWDEFNDLGRKMVAAFYAGWTEDDVVAVSEAFSVPVLDAEGETVSEKPLIGEIDLIVRDESGDDVLVDWKTSARRWSDGKADSHLQATCFCLARHHPKGRIPPFRFDVVTKTKKPAYEKLRTLRTEDHFHRLAELVKVVERAVRNDVFFPNEGGFMCRDCSYSTACAAWHRERTKSFSIAA